MNTMNTMTPYEKQFIKDGACVTPPYIGMFLDIYVNMTHGWNPNSYPTAERIPMWQIVAKIDPEGAGDVILFETEYREIAYAALPVIRAKYMGK